MQTVVRSVQHFAESEAHRSGRLLQRAGGGFTPTLPVSGELPSRSDSCFACHQGRAGDQLRRLHVPNLRTSAGGSSPLRGPGRGSRTVLRFGRPVQHQQVGSVVQRAPAVLARPGAPQPRNEPEPLVAVAHAG